MDHYNSSLSSILDIHAPLKTRTVTFTRSAPWFTSKLRVMKRSGRVLEHAYKTFGLTVHMLAYRDHRKAYAKALSNARSQHYSSLINNNPGNSKQLFSTINHILKPQTSSFHTLSDTNCNQFPEFFTSKINTIHSSLTFLNSATLDCPTISNSQLLSHFSLTTQREVENIIHKSKPST